MGQNKQTYKNKANKEMLKLLNRNYFDLELKLSYEINTNIKINKNEE